MDEKKQINTPTCTNLHQPCTNLTPTYTNSAVGESEQIEEMIETLKKCSCVYTDCEQECSQCSNEELYDEALNHIARTLYEAGYRKQSEGEWIYHECVSSYDGAISGYSCSECCIFVDEEMFDSDEFHKSFCGNCGAHMKGGAE
jgi:hypothetical protein